MPAPKRNRLSSSGVADHCGPSPWFWPCPLPLPPCPFGCAWTVETAAMHRSANPLARTSLANWRERRSPPAVKENILPLPSRCGREKHVFGCSSDKRRGRRLRNGYAAVTALLSVQAHPKVRQTHGEQVGQLCGTLNQRGQGCARLRANPDPQPYLLAGLVELNVAASESAAGRVAVRQACDRR